MKIVIPCAASKVPVEWGNFKGFMRDSSGVPVKFIAEPDLAPKSRALRYVSPNCDYDSSMTFREKLLSYNEKFNSDKCNPDNLLPAYKLYDKPIYSELVESKKYGKDNFYILSAGWGIVRADFLLPMYDITFSSSVKERYKRRKNSAVWPDFNHLDDTCNETVEFIGTSSYITVFKKLTKDYCGDKLIYVNPDKPNNKGFIDCKIDREKHPYSWHYECARRKLNSCCDCK